MPIGAQRFDSRQSMKNKQFEVFHYRDKKMDQVGIHHHDFFEVYFFLSDKVWKEYEQIQSDIFDHLLVMVKEFDLKLYQYS